MLKKLWKQESNGLPKNGAVANEQLLKQRLKQGWEVIDENL